MRAPGMRQSTSRPASSRSAAPVVVMFMRFCVLGLLVSVNPSLSLVSNPCGETIFLWTLVFLTVVLYFRTALGDPGYLKYCPSTLLPPRESARLRRPGTADYPLTDLSPPISRSSTQPSDPRLSASDLSDSAFPSTSSHAASGVNGRGVTAPSSFDGAGSCRAGRRDGDLQSSRVFTHSCPSSRKAQWQELRGAYGREEWRGRTKERRISASGVAVYERGSPGARSRPKDSERTNLTVDQKGSGGASASGGPSNGDNGSHALPLYYDRIGRYTVHPAAETSSSASAGNGSEEGSSRELTSDEPDAHSQSGDVDLFSSEDEELETSQVVSEEEEYREELLYTTATKGNPDSGLPAYLSVSTAIVVPDSSEGKAALREGRPAGVNSGEVGGCQRSGLLSGTMKASRPRNTSSGEHSLSVCAAANVGSVALAGEKAFSNDRGDSSGGMETIPVGYETPSFLPRAQTVVIFTPKSPASSGPGETKGHVDSSMGDAEEGPTGKQRGSVLETRSTVGEDSEATSRSQTIAAFQIQPDVGAPAPFSDSEGESVPSVTSSASRVRHCPSDSTGELPGACLLETDTGRAVAALGELCELPSQGLTDDTPGPDLLEPLGLSPDAPTSERVLGAYGGMVLSAVDQGQREADPTDDMQVRAVEVTPSGKEKALSASAVSAASIVSRGHEQRGDSIEGHRRGLHTSAEASSSAVGVGAGFTGEREEREIPSRVAERLEGELYTLDDVHGAGLEDPENLLSQQLHRQVEGRFDYGSQLADRQKGRSHYAFAKGVAGTYSTRHENRACRRDHQPGWAGAFLAPPQHGLGGCPAIPPLADVYTSCNKVFHFDSSNASAGNFSESHASGLVENAFRSFFHGGQSRKVSEDTHRHSSRQVAQTGGSNRVTQQFFLQSQSEGSEEEGAQRASREPCPSHRRDHHGSDKSSRASQKKKIRGGKMSSARSSAFYSSDTDQDLQSTALTEGSVSQSRRSSDLKEGGKAGKKFRSFLATMRSQGGDNKKGIYKPVHDDVCQLTDLGDEVEGAVSSTAARAGVLASEIPGKQLHSQEGKTQSRKQISSDKPEREKEDQLPSQGVASREGDSHDSGAPSTTVATLSPFTQPARTAERDPLGRRSSAQASTSTPPEDSGTEDVSQLPARELTEMRGARSSQLAEQGEAGEHSTVSSDESRRSRRPSIDGWEEGDISSGNSDEDPEDAKEEVFDVYRVPQVNARAGERPFPGACRRQGGWRELEAVNVVGERRHRTERDSTGLPAAQADGGVEDEEYGNEAGGSQGRGRRARKTDGRNQVLLHDEDRSIFYVSRTQLYQASVKLRYCSICCMYQPLRTKHCGQCGRCIRTHDHHCPWIGSCVAEENRVYFYFYLLLQALELIVVGIIYVKTLIWQAEKHIQNPAFFVVLFMTLMLCMFMACMVTCLFCYHTYLMFSNLTTWESMAWHRISYLKGIPEIDGSPFNRGLLLNIFVYCCPPSCCPLLRRLCLPYLRRGLRCCSVSRAFCSRYCCRRCLIRCPGPASVFSGEGSRSVAPGRPGRSEGFAGLACGPHGEIWWEPGSTQATTPLSSCCCDCLASD
ncbi:dhhc zinc finger domain-containing protein [Cystoisospora suis]|uniref:protein S-acyltransferase n=1 Tax=Cystoisospora suis TaxID=483139 RepID=A0A2C6L3T1_9APIC|nr:dhhc zinc finger domain-containing protein [Cystoisospora suis]